MAIVRPSLILAIDPGTTHSGVVTYNAFSKRITYSGIRENADLAISIVRAVNVVLVIESVESYGMPVGAEVFRTVRWAGYFESCWDRHNTIPATFMPRRDVKLHLCQSARAKDSNIRQALIDKFGGKLKAIGLKKAQGPLYGLKSHLWAALALAVTYHETRTT